MPFFRTTRRYGTKSGRNRYQRRPKSGRRKVRRYARKRPAYRPRRRVTGAPFRKTVTQTMRMVMPELHVQYNLLMDNVGIPVKAGVSGELFGSWTASRALFNMPLPADMEGEVMTIERIEIYYHIMGSADDEVDPDPYNFVRMGVVMDKANVPSATAALSDNTIVSTAFDQPAPAYYFNPGITFDGRVGNPVTFRDQVGPQTKKHMQKFRERTHVICAGEPYVSAGVSMVSVGWANVGRPWARRKQVINFKGGLRCRRSSTIHTADTVPWSCVDGRVPHIFFISDSASTPHPTVTCWTYVFWRDT